MLIQLRSRAVLWVYELQLRDLPRALRYETDALLLYDSAQNQDYDVDCAPIQRAFRAQTGASTTDGI